MNRFKEGTSEALYQIPCKLRSINSQISTKVPQNVKLKIIRLYNLDQTKPAHRVYKA